MNQRVLIDGKWMYCPSGSLMDRQVEDRGIKRGSRISVRGYGDCTALSVYSTEIGGVRVCFAADMHLAKGQQRIWTQDIPLIHELIRAIH